MFDEFARGGLLKPGQAIAVRVKTGYNVCVSIGIDIVGAGPGDRVLVIDEGNSGRQLLGAPNAPVKTLIVGIVDEVEIGGQRVYDHRTQEALSPTTT